MRREIIRALAAGVVSVCIFGISSCTRPALNIAVRPDSQPPVLVQQSGDTLSYMLAFADRQSRRQFIGTFQSFLERYPYASVLRDSTAQYVRITLLPLDTTEAATSPDTLAYVDSVTPTDFIEQVIEATAREAFRPQFGGSAVIYSDREFLDDNLADIARVFPFSRAVNGGQDSAALLTARIVQPLRVQLVLSQPVRNAAGQAVTGFELAERWTSLVKEQPAEGVALFRSVKGIGPFVQGKEAVVPGFVVTGSDAVTLVLERDDPDVLARLSSSRLIPPSLKLGPYAPAKPAGTSVVFNANRNTAGGPPYLEKCTIVLGRDRNPALSYSLKKYDCMVLTLRDDVEYARRNLLADSRLVPLVPERYFLSMNIADEDLRRGVASMVNARQILSAAVRADGDVITAVAQDSLPPVAYEAKGARPSGTLAVLLRAGDPVSARIGQRLLADLSRGGVSCELRALDVTAYEQALVARSFDIAIGWTGQRVVHDRGEQLRLAAIWFEGREDESARIAQALEVPLFLVRRSLLVRSTLDFNGDSIADIYVVREQPLGEKDEHD